MGKRKIKPTMETEKRYSKEFEPMVQKNYEEITTNEELYSIYGVFDIIFNDLHTYLDAVSDSRSIDKNSKTPFAKAKIIIKNEIYNEAIFNWFEILKRVSNIRTNFFKTYEFDKYKYLFFKRYQEKKVKDKMINFNDKNLKLYQPAILDCKYRETKTALKNIIRTLSGFQYLEQLLNDYKNVSFKDKNEKKILRLLITRFNNTTKKVVLDALNI